MAAAMKAKGNPDAHSGFGNFDNRDGFDGNADSGPDVRSGLSGLPARLQIRGLLRMQIHVAASVQHVGIGPRWRVRGQSILCQSRSAQNAVPQVTASLYT